MGIFAIVALFGQVAAAALSSFHVISPTTQTLIQGITGGVANLIPAFNSGSKVTDAISVLAGIQVMLTTLIADPALPSDKLAELKLLLGDVQAGIEGYVTASKGYDAANYAPIALVQ